MVYIDGVINSINVFVGYFLLIVVLPALILGPALKAENIFKRFIIYLMFGNFYISSLVFLLAYLKIFNRVNLIISLIMTSISFWLLINKNQLKKKNISTKAILEGLAVGKYGTKLFLLRCKENLVKWIKTLFYQLFNGKKMEWAIFLPIIAYNVYQYNINNIEFTTYMAPDEEVHLYWIQSLVGGEIFPSGVYPHAFHNILGAITKLYELNAMLVLKYFGPTVCMLIMAMLYFGLRKIFNTKYPALFGLMMYSILNVYSDQVTYRFQFVIPQEYAMIMLMPMAIFLFDYIRGKKALDLICFGISFSLMMGIHFYTAIIAGVLILSAGLVYLYKIIKDKIFFKLFLCGLLSVIVALAPLGIGLALGYEMEQSMDWATDVIKGDIYSENTQEDQNIAGVPKERQALTWDEFREKSKTDINRHALPNIITLYIFIGIILVTIIINFTFILLRKDNPKGTYQTVFAVNSLLLIFLLLFRSLRLPTIMETKRVAIFFAYFSSIWMGMPLEIISRLLEKVGLKRAISFISLGVMALGLFLVIQSGYLRPIPLFYYFQPRGTMVVNMSIMENYDDYTWTAVSPVNNISGVLNRGFHYELSDFMVTQENWNKEQEIRIPTEYVFVYIEKRPIIGFGNGFYKEELDIKTRKLVNKEDATMDFTDIRENYPYKEERYILMAKAYYWAEEYKKYFPKEMNIYYEDDELVVYRIQQNPYALNNFCIDYHLNSQ